MLKDEDEFKKESHFMRLLRAWVVMRATERCLGHYNGFSALSFDKALTRLPFRCQSSCWTAGGIES